jgi:hypothetical protein
MPWKECSVMDEGCSLWLAGWAICARMLIATAPLMLCGNTPVMRFRTL